MREGAAAGVRAGAHPAISERATTTRRAHEPTRTLCPGTEARSSELMRARHGRGRSKLRDRTQGDVVGRLLWGGDPLLIRPFGRQDERMAVVRLALARPDERTEQVREQRRLIQVRVDERRD